ncbi:hypothetical protein GQ600_11345 [Phytophthora cactorum]|nr:hypothetical protein GQ600_11345 [Phytophthora cactorum]
MSQQLGFPPNQRVSKSITEKSEVLESVDRHANGVPLRALRYFATKEAVYHAAAVHETMTILRSLYAFMCRYKLSLRLLTHDSLGNLTRSSAMTGQKNRLPGSKVVHLGVQQQVDFFRQARLEDRRAAKLPGSRDGRSRPRDRAVDVQALGTLDALSPTHRKKFVCCCHFNLG